MRLKRFEIVVVAVLALVALGGCASTSMDAWADRIVAGVALEQATLDGQYGANFKAEALNQKNDVAAAFRDVKAQLVYKSVNQATSKPAEQDAWLGESESILNARLDASRAKEATLRARQTVSDAGFDDIRTSVQHIKDINASWWRTNDSTAVQLQNMAAAIQALTQKVTVAK